MNFVLHTLPALLGEHLLRSSVLIILVALFVLAAKSFSPTQKHFWYMLGFSACLLLPLLSFLPEWQILPSFSQNPIAAKTDAALSNASLGESTELVSLRPSIASTENSPIARLQILTMIWVLGCVAFASRSLAVSIFLHRLEGRSRSAPLRVTERMALLPKFNKRSQGVRTIISDDISSPFTWGFASPRIALPSSVIHWSDQDLDMILAHEWEHVRRRDALAVLLSHTFLAFHWINPFAWIAIRRAANFREEACDNAVMKLGHPFDSYADLLLRSSASVTGSPLPLGSTAVNGGNRIGLRIRSILAHEGPSPAVENRACTRMLTTTLSALALGIGLVGHKTAHAKDPAE